MGKKLEKMTMEELVAGEKAASIVRRNYEDDTILWRRQHNHLDYNDMTDKEIEEESRLSQKLAQINSIRLKIINEMENKLLDIEL